MMLAVARASAGVGIDEARDRDGQYFYYLAMWPLALGRLADVKPDYREGATHSRARTIGPSLSPAAA